MIKRKRIFVVDDEQVIARTVTLILELSGYEACMFLDAESALAEFRLSSPDLVITDVLLPRMNGIAFAEQFLRENPSLHLILMSGQAASSDLVRHARERGFSVHVHAKPVHPQDLLAEIAKLLSRKESEELLLET